jgi:4-diphosphocytidyl-2-C-methyl-D-erythritol kinase
VRNLSSTNRRSESPRSGSSPDMGPMIVRPLGEHGFEILAPAKLNLFLEIRGKRSDGYHDLESLMVTVDLHDTLTYFDDPSGQLALTCDDPTLPTGPDNLVIKAAELLKSETGCVRGAKIDLKKVIPAQAGLAGGSSDAAATLIGLDRLWNLASSGETLDKVAAMVGSDVAFFRQGPVAVCRGRGEIVEAWPIFEPIHFVLVCPPVGVSTADVYRNLVVPVQPRSIEGILEALEAGNVAALGRSLFNRLQPVAESLEPSLGTVRDALTRLAGPSLDGSLMSGSGSAYFGLASDRSAAEDAARRLASLGLGRVRVVTCGP